MITDANNLVGFVGSAFVGALGADSYVLIGILLFLGVAALMLFARVRAGASVMVGASLAVMLSFAAPEFGFLFWIAILVAGFVLINGLRKWITGQ